MKFPKMSLFKVIDAFLALIPPDQVGGAELKLPEGVKNFFGDNAFSFQKVEVLIAAVKPGTYCANIEYETKFLVDVTIFHDSNVFEHTKSLGYDITIQNL